MSQVLSNRITLDSLLGYVGNVNMAQKTLPPGESVCQNHFLKQELDRVHSGDELDLMNQKIMLQFLCYPNEGGTGLLHGIVLFLYIIEKPGQVVRSPFFA